jgi:hypothetical protein
MRVLGALLLLIGLILGFAPGSASASPCPFHSAHTHDDATGQDGDQGAPTATPSVASTELSASLVPVLSEVPSPEPLSGHIVPEGQTCCHAVPSVAPAVGPDIGPPARTGRRATVRAFLAVPSSLAFGIYRPPATT